MQFFLPDVSNNIKIPFVFSNVQAGFPSPANDYLDETLDLNELLIKHPSSTFYVRASGNSMINAGIFNDDILVVDKSLEAKNNQIIIAVINGEFTVKRLSINNNIITLISENDSYENIKIHEDSDFYIWGIVTSVIRKIII